MCRQMLAIRHLPCRGCSLLALALPRVPLQNEMLEEGQEYAVMLYTWRSCSRAIPQVPFRPAQQDQAPSPTAQPDPVPHRWPRPATSTPPPSSTPQLLGPHPEEHPPPSHPARLKPLQVTLV